MSEKQDRSVGKVATIFVELSGNFAPEWRQLLDAVTGENTYGDEPEVLDASIADAAREFVQAVLEFNE